MTTQEIRKNISVINWSSDSNGGFVEYEFNAISKKITLTIPQLAASLLQIASIDNPDEIFSYSLSQWDALNIAIHEELINEINKEPGMMAIDKSIEKLKKP